MPQERFIRFDELAPAEPAGGGPLVRFARGVKEEAIPSVSALLDVLAALNPLTPWKGIDLAGRILSAHAAEAGKAREAFDIAGMGLGERLATGRSTLEGRGPLTMGQRVGYGVEGIGRAAAAGLPVVGPAAASIGEAFATGDPAHTAGRLTGLLASILGPSAALRRLRAIAPERATGRVPMTRGERTGSPVSQFIEALVERSLPGAGPFGAFRQRQQAAIYEAAGVKPGAVSAETVGQEVQRKLLSSREALRQEGRAKYGLVEDAGETTAVSMEEIKVAATELLKRLDAEAAIVPPQELARSRRLLRGIVNAPANVSFQAAQDARSTLGKVARSIDPLPGKAQAIASGAKERMTEAMTKALPPEAATALTEADQAWAELHQTFGKGKDLAKLIATDPTKAVDQILRGTPTFVKAVKDRVPADTWAQVEAAAIDHLLQRATRGEATSATWQQAAGLTTSGVPPVTAPIVDGAGLRRAIEAIGPERAGLLLGEAKLRNLLDVADLATQVQKRGKSMIPGLLAGGVNVAILAPFFGGANVGLTLGKSAAAAASLSVIARIMTRPEGLTGLRRFLRAIGSGQSRAAIVAGQQLNRFVSEQEE